MIAPLFRPISSGTGRLGVVVIAIAVIAFVSPFIPDATWWLS